jgi:hypothetical protein
MAANNFVSNLQVFADLLSELYRNLMELDNQTAKHNKNGKPIYSTMPDLIGVDRLLAGH